MTSPLLRSVAADSNVLLAALASRAARRVFDSAPDLVIVTTEETIAEVEEYLPEFAARYELDLDMLRETLAVLPLERYSERDYITHLVEARRYLEERDPDDVALGCARAETRRADLVERQRLQRASARGLPNSETAQAPRNDAPPSTLPS